MGAVPRETLGEYVPWVTIKLYKAWRDAMRTINR
ncbi:hypothetical protein Rleg9DRAFT_5900 [Rhizobium leguminosarum bv. trifolii WSM597]|uniref:Uncharacterized protein n=1 Tax=Rhizobium leguminosarum bv. trifolii WSM597 TaxID=754764 RepID=I9NG72_RHILT|nr:hypothetical protein Rleg9DRAFT_5900 [Rhizobium leguminosarum bv. trifolii WSM597]